MPSVNWGSSSITTSTTQAVYIRRRWSDPWTLQGNLWAQERVWSLLPATPTATLVLNYGRVLPHGGSSWVQQTKLDIGGWYVKIVDTCADGLLAWYGFIDEVADEQGGYDGSIATGRQTFVAYSMAQALAHEFITRIKWNDPENNTDRWSGSAGTFNRDGKGNMSAAQTSITDDNVFDYGHVSRDFGTHWSSRDIVRYLFSYAMPKDKNDDEQIKFRVDGLELVPDWDKPTLDAEGQSVLSLLTALVDPSRMLQLSTGVDESTTPNTVVFKVNSLASSSLSLPNGETHTANASPIALQTVGAQDTNIATQGSVTSKVDQIVVKGARRETLGTFQIVESGTATAALKEQFTSTVVTAYQAGATGNANYATLTDAEKRRANEIVRSRKTVEDAYRVFTINDKYNMTPFSLDYVFETDDDTPSRYYPWWGATTFMPQLPLKKGVDYSGTAISGDTHDDEKKVDAYREPLILFKRSGTTKYVQAERMANRDNDPSFSVSVGVEYGSSCFSLDVQGAEQYAIAHTRFTALGVDKTTTELGSWNYKDAKCTLSIQEDRWAEAKYPADADLPAGLDVIRRKIIYAGPAYKLIKAMKDTAVDVDDNGALKTVTSSAYLRDDRVKLESIATLAASWYLVTRKVLRLISARPSATPAVGQLVATVNYGTPQADTINTVISEVRLSTPLGEGGMSQAPQYSLTTAMGELDPLAFAPPPPVNVGSFQSLSAGATTL